LSCHFQAGTSSVMAGGDLPETSRRKSSVSQASMTSVDWVDDAAADACMNCHARFGVMQLRRKHHCRRCGKVVCSTCSRAREVVPDYHPAKPQRVCNNCMAQAAVPEASEEAVEEAVEALKSGSKVRPVRATALAGNPLPSRDEKRREFGTLQVRVIEAKGLLAADYGLMNKSSDPYCLLSVAHGVQVRTHTVSATLEPRWDTVISFRLARPDATLHLEVWDEDPVSADDAIGFLDLDLSQVPIAGGSQPVRGWVPLFRPEEQPLPGEVLDHAATGAGAVLLEMQLVDVEPLKHLKSFTAPLPPIPHPPPPFDIDAVYGPAMHLLDLLWTRFFSPILFWLLDLIFWTSPTRSFIALVAWNLGARYGLRHYPALPPLGLLVFMASYRLCRPAAQEEEKVDVKLPRRSLLRRGSSPAILEDREATNEESAQPMVTRQDSKQDYDEAQLGSAVQRLCFVLPSSIKDLCRGLQPVLRMTADGLQMVHDIFVWEHAASPAVACVLLVCAAISEVLRFDILLMVIGSGVLLACSPLVPAVSGSVAYLRLRAASGRPKAWDIRDEYEEAWSSKDYRSATATTSASLPRPRLRHAITKA